MLKKIPCDPDPDEAREAARAIDKLLSGPDEARKLRRSIDKLLSRPRGRRRKTTLDKAADAVETVFKGLGLDPLQPEAWDQVRDKFMAIFRTRQIFDHSGKPQRPTGSAKWTRSALLDLAEDLEIAVRGKGLKASLSLFYGRCPIPLKEAVALIRKRFPDGYKDINDRAISRRLSAAVRLRREQREFEAREEVDRREREGLDEKE